MLCLSGMTPARRWRSLALVTRVALVIALAGVAAAQPAPKKAPDPAPAPKKAPDPAPAPKPVDPYAPAIPARVGLADVPSVQGLLAVQRLDGWLLYDRDGSNPIAVRLVAP